MNGRQRTGLKYLPGRCPVEAMLGVLAGGVRLEIVRLLAVTGPLCTGEITSRLELAMNYICMNLAVLREHGVLMMDKVGKQHIYSLSPYVRVRVYDTRVIIKTFCDGHDITIRSRSSTSRSP